MNEKLQSISYSLAAVLSVVILLSWMVLESSAASQYHEAYYQQIWCDRVGGVVEYRLEDGTRVDCLTDEYAIEFDFAEKWAESIGQALYYGIVTDRKPGVVLIIEREKDLRYLPRLKTVAEQESIKVWTMEPVE